MPLLSDLFNFKFASPDLSYQNETSNIDNKKIMRVYAPQTSTQTTSTYAPVFAPQDNRSLILTMNSSDVSTKKSDKISGSTSSPYIKADQSPTSSFIPDFGTSNPSTSQSAEATQGAMSGNATPWLLIGAVAIGAILLLRGKTHGK